VLALTVMFGVMTFYIRGTVEWPFQGWSRTVENLEVGPILALSLSNVLIFGQDVLSLCRLDQSGHIFLDLYKNHSQGILGSYMLIPQAWTLGIELLFYVVAPFIVTRSVAWIAGIILLSVACRMFFFPALGISTELLGYRFFPFEVAYFALGALSFKIYSVLKNYDSPKILHVIIFTVFLFAYAAPQSTFPEWLRYVSFALCIPSLFMVSKTSKIDRFIGELSYPLYISHVLILYAITQFTGWKTEGPGMIIAIILSVLMYYLVDRNVDRWRETMARVSIRNYPSARELTLFTLVVCAVMAVPLTARHVLQDRHLAQSLPLKPYDLLRAHPSRIVCVGLEPSESINRKYWRWGTGPKTELIFSLPRSTNMVLEFEYQPLNSTQSVSVYMNDVFLEKIQRVESETVYRKFLLPGSKTQDVIRFAYDDWNGKDLFQVSNDARPLAVKFTKLSLTFKDPSEPNGGQ